MGASNSNSGKPMSFFALKAKVDEQNKPFFMKTEKINDVWQQTGTFDTITGMLSGAKIEEKDLKEHGKKKFFVLYLEDEDGVMKLDMSHNAVTYSIINSLSTCADKISDFAINVWRSKPVEAEGGKVYYNGRAGVKRGGEKTEWFVQPAGIPRKEPVMVKDKPMIKDGKQVFDDTEVREFWEKMFTDQIVKVIGSGSSIPAANTSGSENTSTAQDDVNDDLPF